VSQFKPSAVHTTYHHTRQVILTCVICHCLYLCFTKQRVTRTVVFFSLNDEAVNELSCNIVLKPSATFVLIIWRIRKFKYSEKRVKCACANTVTYIKVVLRNSFFSPPSCCVLSGLSPLFGSLDCEVYPPPSPHVVYTRANSLEL
jgi:hypothetical protein